jgi:hypothetical protein
MTKKTDEDVAVDDDPSKNRAVTGRPNDLEIVEHKWALENSTLASRAKAAKKATSKKADA